MSVTTSPPEPSALTSLISASGSGSDPVSALTTQILHNLQHQHNWTSLRVHEPSKPTPPSSEQQPPPTPLLSGIPPHRIYTHPDEQLYLLEKGLRDDDLLPERTFVLPTAQGQSWSLRKLAQVFDSLPETDEELQTLAGRNDVDGAAKDEQTIKLAEYYERREQARATKEWGGKRLLLAMVDKGKGGDGTVVYYVLQEGTVKPRQN
ncbi:hypothetical protein VTN02DRAFT_5562 [Thermoascus thermophilus]